mgnify:CR=1 FL=1
MRLSRCARRFPRRQGATPTAAGEAEQSLIKLAGQYPGQVVAALLNQVVGLFGGASPNTALQRFVRGRLCKGTVEELLSQGLGFSKACAEVIVSEGRQLRITFDVSPMPSEDGLYRARCPELEVEA